ncbi:unnamed protein product [Didymodactylos carnosus]|uniref:Uncharacterized protein n=2 Tax=Didymodactylos carnosus TaxID=1234261 RepID=A0A814HKD5_9BILA|nr:unnamed protein product [Didymodactylos carnosus]CAF3782315.1 unnamed protein product [Didymodactylos carnosus]
MATFPQRLYELKFQKSLRASPLLTDMLSKTVTCFENLSTDLFLHIFDYLLTKLFPKLKSFSFQTNHEEYINDKKWEDIIQQSLKYLKYFI